MKWTSHALAFLGFALLVVGLLVAFLSLNTPYTNSDAALLLSRLKAIMVIGFGLACVGAGGFLLLAVYLAGIEHNTRALLARVRGRNG